MSGATGAGARRRRLLRGYKIIMSTDDTDLGEVYFEYRTIGATVRVAAVHAATGTETIVIGPAHAATADLERLALRKLKATLARTARRDP